MNYQLFDRFESTTAKASSSGRFFASYNHTQDLSKVRLIGSYVDTVRQSYIGTINPTMLERITDAISDNVGHVYLMRQDWIVGKCARASGYQYRLQNNDLGVIILYKTVYKKENERGTHAKIELSPHFLDTRSPHQIQEVIDHYASQLLSDLLPRQCAIHLALDVQGWLPDKTFVERMMCRSTHVRANDAIDFFKSTQTIEYNIPEIATTYGRGQSFLFGTAGGMQLAVYNKTKQAKAIDRLDYMIDKWKKSSCYELDPEHQNAYDPSQDVFRIELRFHHTIVDQVCKGSMDDNGEVVLNDARTYADVSKILNSLWDYGMTSFRLMLKKGTRGMMDPNWQLFLQDALFQTPDPILPLQVKRYYKTSNGFSGKNIDLFIGNWLSLVSRARQTPAHAWLQLKNMSVFPVIEEYYASKGIFTRELKQKIKKTLRDRKLRGYQV